MRIDQKAAQESMITSMGGYGCKKYDVVAGNQPQKITSGKDGLYVSVIQAFEDTTVDQVEYTWDAPADVDGIIIPAGMCLYVKAESVTISSGSGVVYYGITG